jgi:hypothetical protein
MMPSAADTPRQILKTLFMRKSIPHLDRCGFAAESEPGQDRWVLRVPWHSISIPPALGLAEKVMEQK